MWLLFRQAKKWKIQTSSDFKHEQYEVNLECRTSTRIKLCAGNAGSTTEDDTIGYPHWITTRNQTDSPHKQFSSHHGRSQRYHKLHTWDASNCHKEVFQRFFFPASPVECAFRVECHPWATGLMSAVLHNLHHKRPTSQDPAPKHFQIRLENSGSLVCRWVRQCLAAVSRRCKARDHHQHHSRLCSTNPPHFAIEELAVAVCADVPQFLKSDFQSHSDHTHELLVCVSRESIIFKELFWMPLLEGQTGWSSSNCPLPISLA